MRRSPLLVLCAALLALTSACGRAATPAAPQRPAARIVSLAPSATEMLFALGAGERVVGVSTFDDFPPEATQRPRVGGIVNPSFEAIVALRPDALVGVQGPTDRGVLDRLSAMGVRQVFPRVESIDEVLASVDLFASLAGRPREGAALRARLRAELDEVARRLAGRRRPRVVAVFSVAPLVVAGRGSWVDEVLTAAGGANGIETPVRYPTVSVEVVLRAAPEVILDLSWHAGGGDLRALLSAHGRVDAIARGRVVSLPDPVYVRPGPRVGEAVRGFARALHPDVAQ